MGVFCTLAAVLCIPFGNTLVRILSACYPFDWLFYPRLPVRRFFMLGVLVPATGRLAILRPKWPAQHLALGLCVIFAKFSTGLAKSPINFAISQVVRRSESAFAVAME